MNVISNYIWAPSTFSFFTQPFYHLRTVKKWKKNEILCVLSVSGSRIRSDLDDILSVKIWQLLQFIKCIGVEVIVNLDYKLVRYMFLRKSFIILAAALCEHWKPFLLYLSGQDLKRRYCRPPDAKLKIPEPPPKSPDNSNTTKHENVNTVFRIRYILRQIRSLSSAHWKRDHDPALFVNCWLSRCQQKKYFLLFFFLIT